MTRTGFTQQELDRLNLELARATAAQFTVQQIRTQIRSNLERWKSSGVWGTAYEEWSEVADSEDDAYLLEMMVGVSERAVRLRQSPPYIGLLTTEEIAKLHTQAAHRSTP